MLLGLRLDEPLALAGLDDAVDRAALDASNGSASSERADGDGLALTPRGRFLGGGVTAELLLVRVGRGTSFDPRGDEGWLQGGPRGRAYHEREMRIPQMDELSTRKRDILRRVVEEYIATGEPVGSKTARRQLRSRCLGFDRSRRAGRARVARAAHAPAHLGGPDSDRLRLPLLRERGARAQVLRPERFPLDLTSMRSEVEEALQSTTEMLGQVTRLLALVSAPGARDRDRRATSRCCCCSRRWSWS